LTRREGWPWDPVGVRRPGGNPLPCPCFDSPSATKAGRRPVRQLLRSSISMRPAH